MGYLNQYKYTNLQINKLHFPVSVWIIKTNILKTKLSFLFQQIIVRELKNN